MLQKNLMMTTTAFNTISTHVLHLLPLRQCGGAEGGGHWSKTPILFLLYSLQSFCTNITTHHQVSRKNYGILLKSVKDPGQFLPIFINQARSVLIFTIRVKQGL